VIVAAQRVRTEFGPSSGQSSRPNLGQSSGLSSGQSWGRVRGRVLPWSRPVDTFGFDKDRD
jgi:hypothetical protein